jgi:ubiquinone/menaquinone biosynthesis C-methylase UbiE
MLKPPSNANVADRLARRVAREQHSYDEDSVLEESVKLHDRFRHVFHCPNTRFCEQFMQDRIDELVPDRTVLDYGCGNGWNSVRLLGLRPKKLVGIDISQNAIEEAVKRAGDNAEFRVMDAHKLEFPDNKFDLVVGRGILHHLEFRIAMQEVKRVLRKGGYALFAEPLLDNPLRKVYQCMTPWAHTHDELPLSRKQIRWADSLFEADEHVFCGFFSTATGMLTSLLPVSEDNLLLVIADKLDRYLMKTPARYWMRYVYLTWRK